MLLLLRYGTIKNGFMRCTCHATFASELAEVPEVEAEEAVCTPKVEEKKEGASPSPAGVNRRTAVLFRKKASKQEQTTPKPTPTSSRRKSSTSMKREKEEKTESDTPVSRKRTLSGPSVDAEPPPKRAVVEDNADSPAPFVVPPKESFTLYRNLGQQYESEIDSTSDCGSTATSATATDSTSEEFSEDGTPKQSSSSGASKKKGIIHPLACLPALSLCYWPLYKYFPKSMFLVKLVICNIIWKSLFDCWFCLAWVVNQKHGEMKN
jgi:hypothetical protein